MDIIQEVREICSRLDNISLKEVDSFENFVSVITKRFAIPHKLGYFKNIGRISFTIKTIFTNIFVITIYIIDSPDKEKLELQKRIFREVICENISVPFEIQEEKYVKSYNLID